MGLNNHINSLNRAKQRAEKAQKLLVERKKDIDEKELNVITSFENKHLVAKDLNKDLEEQVTFWDKAADAVSTFVGSWKYIVFFTLFILGWIGFNLIHTFIHPFDGYPFTFLNLVLGVLLALQAPLIMMSQNRQSEKDKAMNEHAYLLELKNELTLQLLHEEIDEINEGYLKELLDIQKTQLTILEDLLEKHKTKSKGGK